MTPDELDQAIGSGDLDRVVAVLSTATEAERRAAAEVPRQWRDRMRAHWEGVHSGGGPLLDKELLSHLWTATALAVLGTSSRPEPRETFTHDFQRPFQVLADRRPGWLAIWATEALRRTPACWPLVRRLEQAGLIPRPEPAVYVPGLVAAGHLEGASGPLREEPEILERDIWLLFEVEGNRDSSLAVFDKYERRQTTWSAFLVRLSQEGRLPRERLLDASLDALARDFAQFRAGWFSRFHEDLSPSADERAARTDRYLALLSSSIPPTVSFALKALAVLDRAARLSPPEFLDHAAPALAAREKGTVTQALRLLDRAANRQPVLAERAAGVAVEALLHESPEIQAAALDFIERHGQWSDPALRQLLEDRRCDVAASVKPRLEALLGPVPRDSPPDEAVEVPEGTAQLERARRIPAPWRALAGIDAAVAAAASGGPLASALDLPFHQVPRLDPASAVRPVAGLDELIELLAVLLEAEEPPIEIERALDGVSRLFAERPVDFDRRTAPLRKRATALFNRAEWSHPFSGEPRQDLCALVLAWTTGELVPLKETRRPNPAHFCGLRVHEIAHRAVARRARVLLALPTHGGGWIDPRVLVERVRSESDWELVDAIQALLRLAPDHRHAALAAAADLPGELGDAIRHALGEQAISPGPTAPLWVAAARARDPLDDDELVAARYADLGPDAARAAQLTFSVGHQSHVVDGRTYHHYPARVGVELPVPDGTPVELPTVLHHVSAGQSLACRRWCALIWPAGRHAWFGRGAQVVGGNIDWWEAAWPNRVYLEALLEPETPLCDMGRLLLAIGLAAKEPGEATLSVDALITAVGDGRIDGARLGETLATLGTTRLITGARWAKTLGEAARASALHLEVVRDAVERLFAAAPEMPPGGLSPLLTVFHELCAETGAAVRDERARVFLAGVKGGKSGATSKALLALKGGNRSAHLAAATALALEGRLDRAERWMAWTVEE